MGVEDASKSWAAGGWFEQALITTVSMINISNKQRFNCSP